MADFGDWGSTNVAERKRLEAFCLQPLCGHIRWAHGSMWWAASNIATVSYTEGACAIANCICSKFATELPISEDEIVDLHDFLKPETITLLDLGVPVLSD